MMTNLSFTPKLIEMAEVNLAYQPFIIRYPFRNAQKADHLEKLITSISHYGLLSPIIVHQTKEKSLFIVHGANRFLACQTLGLSTIQSLLIPPSIEIQKVYQLSLSLFLSHKKPNIMEQAGIIRKLLEFFPEKIIIREYLLRLGLPPAKKTLLRINQLADLEDEIAQDLAADKINPELALRLLKLPSSDRLVIYQFLRRLPFTVSQQFEVLEHAQEIAFRDQIPLQNVLADSLLTNILAQDEDIRQKAHTVRLALRKKRYPRLTALEDNFHREKTKLRLPEHLELYPPSNFEHGNYKLEVKFADTLEFRQKLNFLNELVKKQIFQTIIKS